MDFGHSCNVFDWSQPATDRPAVRAIKKAFGLCGIKRAPNLFKKFLDLPGGLWANCIDRWLDTAQRMLHYFTVLLEDSRIRFQPPGFHPMHATWLHGLRASRHRSHPGFACKFRDQTRWNQITKLSEYTEFGCVWFGVFFSSLVEWQS